MKKILTALSLSFLITACSGGGGGNDGAPAPQSNNPQPQVQQPAGQNPTAKPDDNGQAGQSSGEKPQKKDDNQQKHNNSTTPLLEMEQTSLPGYAPHSPITTVYYFDRDGYTEQPIGRLNSGNSTHGSDYEFNLVNGENDVDGFWGYYRVPTTGSGSGNTTGNRTLSGIIYVTSYDSTKKMDTTNLTHQYQKEGGFLYNIKTKGSTEDYVPNEGDIYLNFRDGRVVEHMSEVRKGGDILFKIVGDVNGLQFRPQDEVTSKGITGNSTTATPHFIQDGDRETVTGVVDADNWSGVFYAE